MPVDEFDPDYIYSDKDGDEWEHLDGRWIFGDTHAERVEERKINPGLASLPAVYGPYTPIEKDTSNEKPRPRRRVRSLHTGAEPVTINKNTLDLARQWAADIDDDRQTLSQDTIDAATEVITALPDTIVDGDKLREVIERWSIEPLTSETAPTMVEQLRDLLPAPALPEPTRTMFPGGRVWYIEGPVGDVRATSTGKVVAFGTWQEQPFRIVSTPEKMRTLARTLEAAADHAQKEETNE